MGALRRSSGFGPGSTWAGPTPCPPKGQHRAPVVATCLRLTIPRARHKVNQMVELKDARLGSVFHALGDATRRRMLHALANSERTVSELAEPFDISLAAASKHIKALENAGLICREIRGRTHLCRLNPEPLAGAHEWLGFYERYWRHRLDALAQSPRTREPAASRPPKARPGRRPR
jgi:DNA-binding transcriptional ArsR family regulator